MEKTIAERLTEARERAGRSIRSLQLELQNAGVPGSSYANVHAYLSGRTQPSIEFIEAAARALGHNPEWIAFGQGHPTPSHAMEEGQEWPYVMPEGEKIVLDEVAAGYGDGGNLLIDAAIRRITILHTWRRIMYWPVYGAEPGDPKPGGPKSLAFLETARDVGKAIKAPIAAVGIEQSDMTDDEFSDYVMAMCRMLVGLPSMHYVDREQ